MKKTAVTLALLSTLSMADMLGGEFNVGYYNHTPSGTLKYQGSSIDVENDFKWKKQSDVFAKLYLEHPLPLLPNIKLGYSNFGQSGSGVLNNSITFGNRVYSTASQIDTNLDLKMYDLTLYYEFLDNWLNLDAGVNIKYVDGSISAVGRDAFSNVLNESNTFSVPIPMLYAKARVDIPTTDISFQAEGNYISYDGNQFYDLEAGVRYTLALGLGFEGGYKSMKLKLNNVDDLTLDSTFSGAYAKLVWDF